MEFHAVDKHEELCGDTESFLIYMIKRTGRHWQNNRDIMDHVLFMLLKMKGETLFLNVHVFL